MTPQADPAGSDQAWAAARLRGAVEALNILAQRACADQQDASSFAMRLLGSRAAAADWTDAGLPGEPGGPEADPSVTTRVPLDHRVVVLLARAAMAAHTAGLRASERPGPWERLVRFFAARLPASDPELMRLRERALRARADAGDTSSELFRELTSAVEFHRRVHGAGGYLTSIAQTNLATAFQLRRADCDLAASTALAGDAARVRAAAYGPDHPDTLVARSLLNHSMLVQAENSADEGERTRLARQVLTEITAVRAARDRLIGITAPNATMSRRHEARALLLLGKPEAAQQILELALACQTARGGNPDSKAIGETRFLLAQASRQLGDPGRALEHARVASRILHLHNPASLASWHARRLVAELTAG